MKNQIKLFTVIFSVLVLFSCKDKEGYSKIDNKQDQVKSTIHRIVVNETLNGGNYTYINVDESGKEYWMAIPNTLVKVGETYYYNGGMVMKDFESKELVRTFDFITFAEGIRTTEQAIEIKKENPHSASEIAEFEAVKIDKPANGTSLNELFSDKESFSTKAIIVKGKVVKVNNGIMDKNWVHIIDGTQFEGEKDLGITTLDSVKLGDIVTFKGVITLNKDFGHGYVYSILMEEGKLVK
jgi:hypothetical protein